MFAGSRWDRAVVVVAAAVVVVVVVVVAVVVAAGDDVLDAIAADVKPKWMTKAVGVEQS